MACWMYLEEKTIASLLFNRRFDTLRIGDCQVIANNLYTALLGEMRPSFPVILIERILNGDNGVLLRQSDVQIC
jgi:hypothetical protein